MISKKRINSKNTGTMLIVFGFLLMTIALLNDIFQISLKMDTEYLISVGVVFVCSGTIIKNKKPL